ncbi:MAG: LysM peptidoglycan-binding domain-containing protein [Verrucomicrobia bacterium]|nr:LysM peptidoglycan-binding domain-containing protein [Verrucomicrobiota bacterium]MBS0636545.1 LysM peptidoglycan-binding domain-containing protein [Verrucomicrobiota bacterium]
MDFEMQLSMAGIHPDFAQEKKAPQRSVGVTRKDTIIIAMLVNIALLAVLFATASRQSQAQTVPLQKVEPLVARFETVSQVNASQVTKGSQVVAQAPVDEIDELLKSYAQKAQIEAKPAAEVRNEPAIATAKPHYIEVKVKKGDVLSRIARAHNVKVEDIIVLNGLESANVKIGQVLKIPTTIKAAPQETVAEFYVVKEGDSPWKIAKKCRIEVEDLLRLNNLDEAKAKNLKIGQKLRIR